MVSGKKKFEFSGETKTVDGIVLRRIRALRDIPGTCVQKGDLGGWLENLDNLSQADDAWVYGNAHVYGDARVYGHAQVDGNVWVNDNGNPKTSPSKLEKKPDETASTTTTPDGRTTIITHQDGTVVITIKPKVI